MGFFGVLREGGGGQERGSVSGLERIFFGGQMFICFHDLHVVETPILSLQIHTRSPLAMKNVLETKDSVRNPTL